MDLHAFSTSSNYLLLTQIIINTVLFFFIGHMRRIYYFIHFYWIDSYVI